MQNFSHTIWMGDLETFMDEVFIKRSLESLGETIVSVKVIRNKATGQTLGYGFIEFLSATGARDAMLKLNGKPIPGVPTRRFKLNHASYGKDSSSSECSLFVGELTEDVDDLALFNAFKKYNTCRSAKVVMTNGKSRGYGFVRFMTEEDMDNALIEMQNYCGLGYKPIRVSLAIPKRYNADGTPAVTTSTTEPTSSVVPSGMPDPFTAAVAAAVTGNSAAQAEYYQAYQQYYQQYYASQLQATQFYTTSTGGTMATDTGTMSLAGGAGALNSSTTEPTVQRQQQAFVDVTASQLYAKALHQATGPQEYAPEPHILSSACDRPRHVDDLDEAFCFLESSRWHFTDPSLGLFLKMIP